MTTVELGDSIVKRIERMGGVTITVKPQPETVSAMLKLKRGTVAESSNYLGLSNGEPLLIAMDGLLRYAKAYARQYEGELKDDCVLGPQWLEAAKAIRALLNGDGAVAMERGITTDSKDNGVIESVFWAAMGIAGFTEQDL